MLFMNFDNPQNQPPCEKFTQNVGLQHKKINTKQMTDALSCSICRLRSDYNLFVIEFTSPNYSV